MSYDDYENGKLDGYNEGFRDGVRQALKDVERDDRLDSQDLESRICKIESYLRELFIPIYDG